MMTAGHKFLAIHKYSNKVRETVWSQLKMVLDSWELANHWDIGTSPFVMVSKNTRSEIHGHGLDDPEKIKSIPGVTGTWEEEATNLTPNDLTQLDLRLRGDMPDFPQHLLSFNPVSRRHHLKKRLFDNADPARVKAIHTIHSDNPYIDQDYSNVIASMEGNDATVYARGEWGELTGLIYPGMKYAPLPGKVTDVFYGLDFGFSNPMALVRVHVCDPGVWFEEVIYERGLTVSDLAARMEAAGVRKGAPIYADPAEPGQIEELKRRGYNMKKVTKGPGSVRAGISFLQSLDKFIAPGSDNLMAEAESYMWRKDSAGEPMDEPEPTNDHGWDGIRYGCVTHLATPRRVATFSRYNIGV
jgi:phage terminase large subunit